jgi:hypothetical protein
MNQSSLARLIVVAAFVLCSVFVRPNEKAINGNLDRPDRPGLSVGRTSWLGGSLTSGLS